MSLKEVFKPDVARGCLEQKAVTLHGWSPFHQEGFRTHLIRRLFKDTVKWKKVDRFQLVFYDAAMRLLGVDYGSARIGVALGDTDSGIASALLVIQEKTPAQSFERLCALAAEEGITHLVVGIPRPLADQSRETNQAAAIRVIITQLQARGFIVEEANETFSSKLAMQHVYDQGQKRKRDDLAAAIILQTWLDTRR